MPSNSENGIVTIASHQCVQRNLLLASPNIAIELPLISENAGGTVWISHNAPAYLQARHGLSVDLVQNIAVVEALAAKAAE